MLCLPATTMVGVRGDVEDGVLFQCLTAWGFLQESGEGGCGNTAGLLKMFSCYHATTAP